MKALPALLALGLAASCAATGADAVPAPAQAGTMDLGAFSVSLSVKDLAASRAFYEKLGFEAAGGDPSQNWQIMRNGDHVIGLFQGLFERNMLTFNPGWNQAATGVDDFTDIREIQASLLDSGVALTMQADSETTGPASVMLVDPDGNPILLDQHVPAPGDGRGTGASQ